jgi:hypothetical protein
MSTIQVQPSPYVITKTVGSVQISIISIDFGNSATFNAVLFDTTGSLIVCNQIMLSGADYTAWGNDDNYVTNYILNLYGLLPATTS